MSSYAHNSIIQVPNAIWKENGESLTKGCIYIIETSPPEVVRAYQQQFANDFYSFLKSRAQEIVEGGRMVINMMVSTLTHGPEHMWVHKLMNVVLRDMLHQGLVDQKKVEEFNIPFYPPTMEEVKTLVASEGSFVIHKHEIFTLDWDMPLELGHKIIHDGFSRATFVADTV
ncbi:probable jasmonic acid carboxyl methyltransferase 1 [Spinacia oleracea]|uniref:Probable jasmonic acid carboxyl methyltransferase 1 n=1 Tax=Spinacia oleracea TaxID=3562 RepID=A0ABM3RPU9_SPIOL|nr:probable jasmonic acid carboxyl methyltransferase 1 [Spinacia oleracea]